MSYIDIQDMHHYTRFVSSFHDIGQILEKPTEQRSPSDNQLITATLQKIPLFKNYAALHQNDPHLLSSLAAVFKIEHYPERSVIFDHGELVDKFFLILHGDVRKYVPRDNEDIEKDKKARYILQHSSTLKANQLKSYIDFQDPQNIKRLKSIANLEALGSPDKAKVDYRASLGNLDLTKIIANPNISKQRSPRKTEPALSEKEIGENLYETTPEEVQFFRSLNQPKRYFSDLVLRFRRVKGLLTGDYFGDVALASSLPNDTMLVAWNEVCIASIEKKDYEELFKTLLEDTRDKVDFLIPNLLPGFSSKTATSFTYNFRREVYYAGDILFSEGTQAKGFWMIKEGEIELYKTMKCQDKKKVATATEAEDGSPKKQKKHKVSIVRLSSGQLLGEEIIIGIKERLFTAIWKSSKSVVYFLDEKFLKQTDEAGKEVIKYLVARTKMNMESKLQRLNTALQEVSTVLNLPAEGDSEEASKANKAKQTIDYMLNDFNCTEKEREEREKTSINTKTMLRLEHSTEEAAEWKSLERLAGLKYKLVLEKTKIDPKLLGNKKMDKAMEHKGYYESPDKMKEMEQKERKFYYPSSLFEHCIKTDKHLSKKRELQKKLHRNLQSLDIPLDSQRQSKNAPEQSANNLNLVKSKSQAENTSYFINIPYNNPNSPGRDPSGRISFKHSVDFTELPPVSPTFRVNTDKAKDIQEEVLYTATTAADLSARIPSLTHRSARTSTRLKGIVSPKTSSFAPSKESHIAAILAKKSSLPSIEMETFSPLAKMESPSKLALEQSLRTTLDNALKFETLRDNRDTKITSARKEFGIGSFGGPLSGRNAANKDGQQKSKHNLMRSMFDRSMMKETAEEYQSSIAELKPVVEPLTGSPREVKLPKIGK